MVSIHRVLELLSFDPKTGLFTWKVATRNTKPGELAGHVCRVHGYRLIGIDRRVYAAHRLAWLVTVGCWPSGPIDHINGDRIDNRIANLREATPSENLQNQEFPRGSNPHLGVSWQKSRGKWRADICVNHQQRFLGRFDTQEEARVAYLDAKRALHVPGRLIWPDLQAPKTEAAHG